MVKRQGETALNHSFPPADVVMKYLIVNGDDFGASPGINRGIMQAHLHGILTSTSLLVKTEWAEQAASLSSAAPDLSVGLHADVRNELREPAPDSQRLRESLQWQFCRFEELMGRPPRTWTHTTMIIVTHGPCRIFSNWRGNMGCRCANIRRSNTSRSFTVNGLARRTLNKLAQRNSP